VERRAILSTELVFDIRCVLDDCNAPAGVTRSAWQRRILAALAPLPNGDPIGLTVAQVNRIIRVVIEAEPLNRDPRITYSWRKLRIHILEQLNDAHPQLQEEAA
jgi:hypothetical protein